MNISHLSQKNQLILLKFAYKLGGKCNIPYKEITKRFLDQKVKSIPTDLAGELAEKIRNNTPFLLARLGGTEGAIAGQYCEIMHGLRKSYEEDTVEWLFSTSGVFADDYVDRIKAVDRYAELTLEGLLECDYLSAMFPTKIYMPFFFLNYAKNAVATFSDYGPTFERETAKTWYAALEGRRILVVNSFTESIQQQYKRKELLAQDKAHELPDFELITYQSAVTQMGERYGSYQNSFEVLEKMIHDIDRIEFDVALIGAGAYGFPLSVAIKRMGKIAIETCGTTPYFFGVYDERFVRQNGRPNYMTDAWIRPMEHPPQKYKEIEGGCYW